MRRIRTLAVWAAAVLAWYADLTISDPSTVAVRAPVSTVSQGG